MTSFQHNTSATESQNVVTKYPDMLFLSTAGAVFIKRDEINNYYYIRAPEKTSY